MPSGCLPWSRSPVALLAEGVGRNTSYYNKIGPARQVALLAEGVGRNADQRQVLQR